MNRLKTVAWILLIGIAAALVAASPGQAQAPLQLLSVDPPAGYPGQQLQLTLRGVGFSIAKEVRVVIPDLNVLWSEVVSDQEIQAEVSIPPSAPPGLRPVQVIAIQGTNEQRSAGLENGFQVLQMGDTSGGNQPSTSLQLLSVDPPAGQPGQQLQLTLRGSGFSSAQEVRVVIPDLEVPWSKVVSDQEILAEVSIPPSAPPGLRPVQLIAIQGSNEQFTTGLENGFQVLGEASPGGDEPQGEQPGVGPVPGGLEIRDIQPPPVPPAPFPWDGALIALAIAVGLAVWRLSRKPARSTERSSEAPTEVHFEVIQDDGEQSLIVQGESIIDRNPRG